MTKLLSLVCIALAALVGFLFHGFLTLESGPAPLVALALALVMLGRASVLFAEGGAPE